MIDDDVNRCAVDDVVTGSRDAATLAPAVAVAARDWSITLC